MRKIFLLLFLQAAPIVIPIPISVPVDYQDAYARRLHNAHYNRLPPNVQVDETQDYDEADYDDQQTDKPSPINQQSSASYNQQNNNLYSHLLTENRIKIKKRRKKIRRPCIPIQSFNSQLFSNRLKREIDPETGKTFGALFGNGGGYYPQPIGVPFYGNYYGGGGGNRPNFGSFPAFDNTKPQYDTGVSNTNFGGSSSNLGGVQYNPIGGYPCIPVSTGHIPHGGGGGGSPLGFFGQGGLFDFGSSASPSFNTPSISYPQTVIINRPPLFGNRPSYFGDRPTGTGSGSGSGGGSGINNDSRPGFWGSVLDKLQEFVTEINPQQVFTSLGDTLQNIGTAIQNAQPVAQAAQNIRTGYREFSSLIFR